MPDDPSAAADSQPPRTTGGNFRWEPPTPAELQALMPGYTIEKLLGRGGMGAVYKGIQTNLERTVAIKILPPGVEEEDPSFAERFKNEAKLMAKLMHPAVVGVFDFGTTSGGQLYIAMEYVDGTDVSQMIRSQGKLPPDHALAITAHVCDALAAAHKLGIVHRDIKPANILINMEGAVKVADFGLAKIEEPGTHGLTKTGYAMGTPDFVAPEALMLGTAVDGRADLYAVGVMLYQMLTGNIPRGAFKPAAALVPGLDPRYDPIILKAMQHDREERHQSSAELRRDLDVILTVPLVQQNAPAAAAVPAAQVAQVPAQRSAAQKPVAKGPSSPAGPQGKPAAVAKQQPESRKQKSATGLYIGIAATVAVLGALVFLFSGKKPAAESGATASADARAKPAAPVKVADTSKPAVIKTPAPKPPASASVPATATASAPPSTVKWHDMLGEWRAAGQFVGPRWKDDGSRVEALVRIMGETPPPARTASPDQALRITCTAPTKYAHKFFLRASAIGNYTFLVMPSGESQLWVDVPGGKASAPWPAPPGFDPKVPQTWEFRAVGDTLSAHFEGKLIGSVTDGLIKDGVHRVFNIDQGTVITAMEYASLGSISATWRDWVAEGRARKWFNPSSIQDDGKNLRWPKYWPFDLVRVAHDAAVRVTWTPTTDSLLSLRTLSESKGYEKVAVSVPSDGTLAVHHWNVNGSKQKKLLKSFAFPAGIAPRAEHTLEVRLIGSVLSTWVNGQPLGSVDNVPVWDGAIVLNGYAGLIVKRLEYAVLDGVSVMPPPPTGTTPAPAVAAPAKTTPAVPTAVPPGATKAAAPAPMPPPGDTKADAPADPVAIRLAEIEKQFLAAYEKQAGAAHKTAVADLNVKFSAALDRSIATVSQAGKLDEALELRNEKALIQTRGTVPEDDAADMSETLKTLRKTYRVTMTTLLASRAKNAAPLHAAYDRALAAYQEELTKAQKLDDALRVKAVREHVSTQRETPAAPQPSTPATGAAISSAASDKTSVPIAPTAPPLSADKVLPPLPKATPEEIRAVVEWCLGKGGDVMVLDNALKKRVNKIDLLPKGKLTLVEFKVDEMAMDAEGLKWLAILGRAPDLEVLFFTRNPGTLPGERLRGATKLRILGIKPTAVDDAAFAHLAGLKNLEELQLHSLIEQFTGTGLGYITENLLRLVVDSPTLTQEGMNYLPRFKKLQLLSFNNYSVRGRCLVTDAMLRNVAALPELTELDLAKTRIDGSFLVHLPTNSKLKRLDLGGITTFKPENFAHIAKLKQLEVLGLPPMTLGNTELAAVASLRMLRELLVFSNATFTGEGFKGLKGFGSLTLLELSASPVTDAGLAAIGETLPHLKSIRMAHAPEFKSPSTAAGFAALTSRLKELNDIQIGGSGITDDWMPAIAQAKGVTYMMLTGARVTDQGVAHLMKLPLGYLRLDGTQVTDAVIPIIKTCPTLGNVPVSGTKMTEAGKAELQRVLDAHRGK